MCTRCISQKCYYSIVLEQLSLFFIPHFLCSITIFFYVMPPFNFFYLLLQGLSDWVKGPELTKITTQPMKLTTVRHKVVMETAPEGSQYPGTNPPSNGQSLALSYKVDRPFIFLIRDEPSGALLFIGKVLNPRDLASV